jgi:RNA 3'-terminal phosphate cyclase-like protein
VHQFVFVYSFLTLHNIKGTVIKSNNPSQSTMSSNNNSQMLRFDDGAVQFRQRLVVSIVSCRPLLIRNIRSEDLEAPGLRQYEASFLRLIDSMTNGSRIEINNTGTQLRFVPGLLVGGDIQHECPQGDVNTDDTQLSDSVRSIGWFLEGILPLAPFGKEPLRLQLFGITDGTADIDPSVDYLKASVFPIMKLFQIGDVDANDFLSPSPPVLKILTRGAAPAGGGVVEFYCPTVKDLKPIDYTDPGLFKRVRGTATSCKVVSSSMAARAAYSAKGVLHRLLPDIWIHTDVHSVKQHGCGPSPSLSLVLTAESTTGVMITAECVRQSKQVPEDLGTRAACMLLEEIRKGGCIDTGMQSLTLLWMCLTPEDVSRIRIGTLSQYTIESLRLFKQALGVEFKVRPDLDSKTVLLSCLGTGYRNMARASS